jgi:hypothetical protein
MNLCEDLHPENYYDTVFEKVLIDSDKTCPRGNGDGDFGNNQCVYQCKNEFHLIENNIDMP